MRMIQQEQPAAIFCLSWNQALGIAPKDVIKQTGIYREDKDHMVLDFAQPINSVQHQSFRNLFGLFQQVSQSGYRYLMFYNDEPDKKNNEHGNNQGE